jgi:hypothetical protein
MTTKTPEEMAVLREQGPVAVKEYLKAEERNVFGHDVKHDSEGNPIEQGIGAPGHETANHFAALRKNEQLGLEPKGAYDRAVADLWDRDPKRAKKLGLPKSAKAA